MTNLSQLLRKRKLNEEEVSSVNTSILLIRNILHIPDMLVRRREKEPTLQNQILWNLFCNDVDQILLNLISHDNCSDWCTTIVQLIALIYKDQHVVSLQQLLQSFIDSSLSESSDNESNTGQQEDFCNSPVIDSSSEESRVNQIKTSQSNQTADVGEKSGQTSSIAGHEDTDEPP